MGHAFIDGKPAALAAAIDAAAKLLAASRLPVIAGLSTDVAGASAAVALARRLRGVVDHMHSDALLRNVEIVQQARMMTTTPNEARLRADLLLLAGPGLVTAWPELPDRLFVRPAAAEPGEAGRRIVWLCPGRTGAATADANIKSIGRDAKDLPAIIAALRARIAGHPIGKTSVSAKSLDALATELKAARFGVAVWSAAELDALTIEMLCGMVAELNAHTRFSGLPLALGDNAAGVLQACGWMTGLPVRTSFGRGQAEYDPWRFEARRLAESGEADCALWVSAYGDAAPNWTADIPMIALTGARPRFRRAPRVRIAVGRPGVDHDSVEYLPITGTLAAVAAKHPSETISVAEAIGRIASRLPDGAI